MEDIKADNNQVVGALDISTGEMVFSGINQILPFRQSSYGRNISTKTIWNPDKFPKSVFQGKDLKS